MEWLLEQQLSTVSGWQSTQQTLWGQVLRQFLMIAPIEEGCKLLAVMIPLWGFQQRWGLVRASSAKLLLAMLSVALGFTAQESILAVISGRATIIDRTLGTPVHGLFSATCGWAIAQRFQAASAPSDRAAHPLWNGWLTSVTYHGFSNSLATIVRLTNWIGGIYILFGGWLWLGWRLDQLISRSHGHAPRNLIPGTTQGQRWQRRGLVLLVLILGSVAISGLRDFGNVMINLWGFPDFAFIDFMRVGGLGKLLLRSMFLGAIAILIFRYLYRTAE